MSQTIEDVVARIRRNWPEVSAEQAREVFSIARQARLVREAAQTALRDFDLTHSEFELLAALRSHGPPFRLNPTDLYEAMLMSSGGLTKLLKGLETRGLVSRPQGLGDGRSKPVQLTPAGCALVETAMPVVQTAEAPLLRGG